MSLIYFHGLPGSPTELEPLASAEQLRRVFPVDWLATRGATYAESVVAAFDSHGIDGPIDVAGFSLGAMAALHIAALRAEKVRKLILISPAAPLELGDFLPQMAGRPVFEAARRGAFALRCLSTVQGVAAAIAPDLMLQTMFANSAPAERLLLDAPGFRATLKESMRQCLGRRQQAYGDELRAYVRPWADILAGVSCDVEIWQGDQDTWTPMAMAQALQSHLGRATLKVCAGLGHYSTLREALAQRAA